VALDGMLTYFTIGRGACAQRPEQDLAEGSVPNGNVPGTVQA
jgi:hypothetical protein